MKNLYNKIVSFIFVGVISVSLACSLIFGFNDIKGSLSENKDKLLDAKPTSSYFHDVISIADGAFNDGFFLRDRYVDLYGGLQRITGGSIVWDSDPNKTTMIGSDGKLYSSGNITMNFSDYTVNEKQLDDYAEKIIELGTFAKKNGSDIIFFQTPARYDSDLIRLPVAVSDSDKKNVDYLYERLNDNDAVTVLNAQNLYKKSGIDFKDLFFRTDHHWTIKTAFWAYSEICRALNEHGLGIDEVYYDLNNYKIETFYGSYLGSLGKMVGGLFVGYDDFDFIYPKFDTDYTKIISRADNNSIEAGGSIEYKGSFTEAVLSSYGSIKERKTDITFGSYVSSDRSEVVIRNSKAATSKKALIIKDSFGLPVSAFLSTCFEEEVILDPRYYNDRSICEYISDYKPDAVILIYNPGAYNDVFFRFGG